MSGVVLVSVYYYKLFGGYCVAAWRPCNVKLAKVISSVLPQLPYRCEHVEGQREKERKTGEKERDWERESKMHINIIIIIKKGKTVWAFRFMNGLFAEYNIKKYTENAGHIVRKQGCALYGY